MTGVVQVAFSVEGAMGEREEERAEERKGGKLHLDSSIDRVEQKQERGRQEKGKRKEAALDLTAP